MPSGISKLINIVSSMVIRKKHVVFSSQSLGFFSHCSDFQQELVCNSTFCCFTFCSKRTVLTSQFYFFSAEGYKLGTWVAFHCLF